MYVYLSQAGALLSVSSFLHHPEILLTFSPTLPPWIMQWTLADAFSTSSHPGWCSCQLAAVLNLSQ